MATNRFLQHWPVVALVLAGVIIFGIAMTFFQVEQTEYAYVKRFSEPVRKVDPGLHPKWPWPIETTWIRENRIHSFEGQIGVYEEVFTKDEKNIIVTFYLLWKIGEDKESLITFMRSVDTEDVAEEHLTSLLRSYRSGVLGDYNFSDLVNVDPEKVKIDEVEADMRELIAAEARAEYGIEVVDVGIKFIGLPDAVSQEVNNRMIADRERLREGILAAGEAEAESIRSEADKFREIRLAEARNKASKLRAEGDAAAAEHYVTFEENPALAKFVKSLDAFRQVTSAKTTWVLGPDTVPFNLLQEDVTTLEAPETDELK